MVQLQHHQVVVLVVEDLDQALLVLEHLVKVLMVVLVLDQEHQLLAVAVAVKVEVEVMQLLPLVEVEDLE